MRSFLAICFLFLACGSRAQKYAFVSYSTQQGLPQTQVHDICQDDDGYLWIATLGGLARYNGNEIITFSAYDGLFNNRIQSLDFFDNTLWIGHDGGISYLKKGVFRSVGFTGDDKSRRVSQIFKFKNRLFICTDNGGLFRLENHTLVSQKLPGEHADRIRQAYSVNNVLYLATNEGVFVSEDGTSFKRDDSLPAEDYCGVVGSSSHLFFATYDATIYKRNLSTAKETIIDSSKVRTVLPEGALSGIYLDDRGDLWVYTLQDGVVVFKADGSVRPITTEAGLPTNSIRCFYKDREGNMWLGSFGKGLFRFSGETFSYFDISSGLQSELFLCGFEANDGSKVLGTLDKGLLVLDKNGNSREVDVDQTMIWAVVKDVDGKDWIGTQSSLVSMDASGNREIFRSSQGHNLPGDRVTTFYRVSSHEMYVGGSGGVSHYKNGRLRRIGVQNDESIGTVREFAIHKGKLICGSNLGLFIYTNSKFIPFMGVDIVVYSLQMDNDGQLWVGTEEGLFRIRDNEFERIELSRNPASNFINFVNCNGDYLFVGTNNGLYTISRLTSDVTAMDISYFGNGEGLVDLETNLNSDFFDSEGNLWFGTASGLVCFHVKNALRKPHKPFVSVSSILLNYEEFEYSNYSEKLNENGFPEHMVLPNGKNNLIFKLNCVSLSEYRGMQFQFWLEGQDETWSPPFDDPLVSFTNVSAGDYILHMRSLNAHGNFSNEITVSFTILEAFYKTWWFICLCIVLFLLIIVMVFRLRLRRINELNEKEKLEYKTRLLSLEQQSMNASMNRHFVFNSLNSIQYFINTQDRISANKYLTNFANLIRKNLDSATSEGNMISMEEELERIRLYLSLESMRFKDRFDYNINVDPSVHPEFIQLPSMILQPFVENSIIHGILPNHEKKGRIDIDVTVKDKELHISLKDNGIGVNQSVSKKSEIAGDHQSKGMEITSKRIELIQKISNSNITLDGPKEIIGENGSINGTYVLLKISLE